MNRDKRIEIAEEVYACIQRARLPLLGEGREGLNENSCNKQERSTGAPDDVLCSFRDQDLRPYAVNLPHDLVHALPRSQNRRARTELRLGSRDHADNGECRRRHC